MKFKLDENIGIRGRELLLSAGHEVHTVRDQGLGGVADEEIFQVCATEGYALITLDHDFGQVLRFPPGKSSGIVVLELPPQVTGVALHRGHMMSNLSSGYGCFSSTSLTTFSG